MAQVQNVRKVYVKSYISQRPSPVRVVQSPQNPQITDRAQRRCGDNKTKVSQRSKAEAGPFGERSVQVDLSEGRCRHIPPTSYLAGTG